MRRTIENIFTKEALWILFTIVAGLASIYGVYRIHNPIEGTIFKSNDTNKKSDTKHSLAVTIYDGEVYLVNDTDLTISIIFNPSGILEDTAKLIVNKKGYKSILKPILSSHSNLVYSFAEDAIYGVNINQIDFEKKFANILFRKQ